MEIKLNNKISLEFNTCNNCRYCKIISSFPDIYCKRIIDTVNYVTGEIQYKECATLRRNSPVCTCWEQGGIKGFFQRLFKKLKK